MNVKELFGRNLAMAREESKLTQTELADRAYMDQPRISTFERGVVCPRRDSAVRLGWQDRKMSRRTSSSM